MALGYVVVYFVMCLTECTIGDNMSLSLNTEPEVPAQTEQKEIDELEKYTLRYHLTEIQALIAPHSAMLDEL